MQFRYPGPKPFAADEESLFFGRTEEIDKLKKIIELNRLTILFGRSGFGKSSLIQAGVIPYFKSSSVNYKIIEIRFTSQLYDEKGIKPLRLQLTEELNKIIGAKEIFFGFLNEKPQHASLWQLLKTIQWHARNESYRGIFFILDQFEEVFNYSHEQYNSLAKELAELVYNRIPNSFQEKLLNAMNDEFAARYQQEIEFINSEIPVSYLIGIRSDRLYFLDELGEVIPVIFNNRFRLRQLKMLQLKEIIQEPALRKGDFESPRFIYSEKCIQKIGDFFSEKDSSNPAIEAFELQIICKHIEETVIRKYGPKDRSEPIQIDEDILPENMGDIIRNYYADLLFGHDKNRIASFTPYERLVTRYLVEKKLIDRKTNNRVCLDQTSITPLGVNEDLLNKLIQAKIIRRELNTVSGKSYELSHDTLVQPILNASISGKLEDLDSVIKDYYLNLCARQGGHYLFSGWRALEKKFIDDQGNTPDLFMKDFDWSTRDAKRVDALQKAGVINVMSAEQDYKTFSLNEVFRDTISGHIRRYDFNLASGIKTALIIIGSAFILSLILGYFLLDYSMKETYQRIGSDIEVKNSLDKKDSAERNMQVLNIIYSKLANDTERVKKITPKFISQFHSLYDYAHKYNYRDQSLIDYSISLDNNSCLALFSDAKPGQLAGNSQIINALRKTAVLINTTDAIKSWDSVSFAGFIPNSNVSYYIKDDKLYLPPDKKPIIFTKTLRLVKFIDFKPKALINGRLIFAKIKFYNVIVPYVSASTGLQEGYYLINTQSGRVIPLSSNLSDYLFVLRDGSGFLRINEQLQLVERLDSEGRTKYEFPKDFLLKNGIVNPDGERVFLDGLAVQPASLNSIQIQQNTGIHFYDFNGKRIGSFVHTFSREGPSQPFLYGGSVQYQYDHFGRFQILTPDSLFLFNSNYKCIDSFSICVGCSPFLDSSRQNLLLSAKDSLILINTQTHKRKSVPRANQSSAYFSGDGRYIYSFSVSGTSAEATLTIFNKNLKAISEIRDFIGQPGQLENKVIFFRSRQNNYLMWVNPATDFNGLNNTDAAQISSWIGKKMNENKLEISGDIYERYHLPENKWDQLKLFFKK